MSNKRIFYAVQSVAFSKNGLQTFTGVHGLQSIGINTKFNLEQVFELGQISIYNNVENIPDVEITMEKCLDGYPLIYHLATNGSTSASLSGRSNIKAIVGLSVYSDTQDSASGTAVAQCQMSGVFVSNLQYTLPVQGNCQESVTLVGNNKFWNQSFTAPTYNNLDSPSYSGGVNRRQHVIFGSGYSKLPSDIVGVNGDNYLYLDSTGSFYNAHIQSIRISANLGREALYELGRRGVYHRYVTFPVEVRCDIELIATTGDAVNADENASSNLSNQPIYVKMLEGSIFDLGVKNKMSSITYGGGNAGQNGGNVTVTYSYVTFNDLTVTHPQDPSGL